MALVVSRRTQKYSQIFLRVDLYTFLIAALIEFINLSLGGQSAYFYTLPRHMHPPYAILIIYPKRLSNVISLGQSLQLSLKAVHVSPMCQ